MTTRYRDDPYAAPAGTPPMGGGQAPTVPNSPAPQTQWNRPLPDPSRAPRMIRDAVQRRNTTEMTRRDRASSAYGGTGNRERSVGPLGGFDPNRPGDQYTVDGKADMGANNGFNMANFWDRYQAAMGQTGDAWQQGQQRAGASRGRADATRDSYTAPQYQMPNAYAWNEQRAPMMNDEDFAASFNRYGALMDQTGGPIQSRDAEATDVGGFGDAFYRYANAGANILQTRMKDSHRQLTDNAAGRGRLNTGFFDEDTGELWRTLGSEAQDQINSRALEAANLDMQPAMQNARLRTDVSVGNANRNLEGQRYGQDDRQFLMDFTAGREDTRGQRADDRYESDRGFDFDRYRDERGFGRGVFESDRGFGRDAFESDRGFDEDRYRFDENLWRGDRGEYMDQLTGARDWRFQQQQNEAAQRGGSFLGGLGRLGLGLAGSALGPLGGMAGQYLGGRIFGGGGGGQSQGLSPDAYGGALRTPFRSGNRVSF